jgi:hypothetical protein
MLGKTEAINLKIFIKIFFSTLDQPSDEIQVDETNMEITTGDAEGSPDIKRMKKLKDKYANFYEFRI